MTAHKSVQTHKHVDAYTTRTCTHRIAQKNSAPTIQASMFFRTSNQSSHINSSASFQLTTANTYKHTTINAFTNYIIRLASWPLFCCGVHVAAGEMLSGHQQTRPGQTVCLMHAPPRLTAHFYAAATAATTMADPKDLSGPLADTPDFGNHACLLFRVNREI